LPLKAGLAEDERLGGEGDLEVPEERFEIPVLAIVFQRCLPVCDAALELRHEVAREGLAVVDRG